MKRTIILLAFLLTLSSCVGFLDEIVTTSLDGDIIEAADTPMALEANILGCHRQFAGSGFSSGAFNEWLSPGSGLHIYGNTSALNNPLERWACNLKFTRFSKHPEGYESFSSFYKAIYRCNSLISILPKSPVDSAYKREIEGEAQFIRAMAYFYLVRLYGDVSLILTPPTSLEGIYRPREDFWVVYAQIIKDLTEAADKMRSYERMVAVSGGNSSGRVCKDAAIACRSLVYLTIGTLLSSPKDNFWLPEYRVPDFKPIGIEKADDAFKKALKDAEDVIASNTFELCSDYRTLFRWTEATDWQLRERVWAIPRSTASGNGGSALTMWALPNYYNNTDDVPNYGRLRPDRWFFQKWCEMKHGEHGTGVNNKDIYVNCSDPRLDVNIIHTSYLGRNSETQQPLVLNCYPSDDRVYPGNTGMMKAYGIPYFKKYYDPTYNGTVGNAHFYLMRYAEVFLIAAEAAAHLDNPEKAVKYVNKILERARNSVDGEPSPEPAAWDVEEFRGDKQALLDAIFWERCFEMPFEQHEWFDTHRMGAQWLTKNIAVPKNVFLYEKEQEDYALGGSIYDGYRTLYYGKDFHYDEDWNDVRKGLICGYPNDELVYNTELDVNLHDPNRGQNPEKVFWR